MAHRSIPASFGNIVSLDSAGTAALHLGALRWRCLAANGDVAGDHQATASAMAGDGDDIPSRIKVYNKRHFDALLDAGGSSGSSAVSAR